MKIDGIILAAGLSRRMGENKLLLPFLGKPLLRHVLDLALLLPLASVVLVTTKETAARVHIPSEVRLVHNPCPEQGQSLSIRLALQHSDADGYLFFPADQPLLDADTAMAVLAQANPRCIVVPAHGGVPGSPAFFPAGFKEELMALRGDAGGRGVRERHPEACLYAEVGNASVLRDIDTPEQYRHLLSQASP